MKVVVKQLKLDEALTIVKHFAFSDNDAEIESITNLITKDYGAIFGLFKDGKFIGELRVQYRGDDPDKTIVGKRVYLFALRILPKHRNKGYGSHLMENVLEKYYRQGYREFTLGVEKSNTIAYRMYEKLGFNTLLRQASEYFDGANYDYDILLMKIE